jgi:hypothetical protein
VLHRPRQQELVQLLQLQLTRRPPPQILRHQPKMVRPRLRPAPLRADRVRSDLKLLGQPNHRRPRRGRHVIRHEPQPRQRAQGYGKPEPVDRTSAPARINERDVGRSEREESEQLLPANLREPPQGLQFLVREHLSDQQHLQPEPEDPQLRSLPSHIRPIFLEYYGDPGSALSQNSRK